MATVVPFEPRSHKPAARGAARDGPAAIIMFPGVRYESEDKDDRRGECAMEILSAREPELR